MQFNNSIDICQTIFFNPKILELDEPLFFQDSNEQEVNEPDSQEAQEPQRELSELDFFYNYDDAEQCPLRNSGAISESANLESTDES